MSESLKRRVEGSLYAVQLLSLIPSRDLEDADYMDGLVERMIRDGSHAEIEDAAEAKPEPIARLGATVMPFGAQIRELYPTGRWKWHEFPGRKQSNAEAPEVLITRGSDG